MLTPQWLFASLLVLALVLQALLPGYRLMIVMAGAALACAGAATLGIASVSAVFAGVPWNVLLILVALGLFTHRLAATQIFGLASVGLVRLARAQPVALLVLSAIGTYLVSSVVNNLTALMVLLPVLLTVFALSGVSQRYAAWTLGVLLVACNLGGAATPIGDFPAVLLLGRGTLSFDRYLADAMPVTLLCMALLLLIVVLAVRPARDVPVSVLGKRLTLVTLAQLYRGVRLDWGLLAPCLAALLGMVIGWLVLPASWGVSPEMVAWFGAGLALLAKPREGEAVLKRAVDVESALFLLALFLMVAVVRETGFFASVAHRLVAAPLAYEGQVVIFLIAAAVLTGLFSAGPSMAALLEVADVLAVNREAAPVYIGLALAVCAGSSLFLTAATAGPLMQTLVERAGLKDLNGTRLGFGFREFVPVGLLGFTLILSLAIARALWVIR